MVPHRRRSASRTSGRGNTNTADGLASVHENDEGSFNDDSDDESEAIGMHFLIKLAKIIRLLIRFYMQNPKRNEMN